MTHPFFIVDVFAEKKYAGNQLAVVRHAADLDAQTMQLIARETNFAETTFVLSDEPHNGGYDVRIFTPAAEVPFAGHPTIGRGQCISGSCSLVVRLLAKEKVAGPNPVSRFSEANYDRFLHNTSRK